MLQIPYIEEPRLPSPQVSKKQFLETLSSARRRHIFVYGSILLAGFFLSQYFLARFPKKNSGEIPYREMSLQASSSAGSAVIVSTSLGPQSVGEYRLTYKDYTRFDSSIELHLLSASAKQDKTLGYVSAYSPETSAAILSFPPRVVFLREFGGEKNEIYSPLNSALVVYAILSDSYTLTLTLADIKARFPNLDIPRSASLHTLLVSPSGNRVAFNYSYALEADFEGDMIVVNLLNGKVSVLGEKGKLKQWVNDFMLRYDAIDTSVLSSSSEPRAMIKTRDVSVPY